MVIDFDEAMRILAESDTPMSAEDVVEFLRDVTAEFSPGDAALLGQALSALGALIVADAKTVAAARLDGQGEYSDSGMLFKRRAGGTQQRLSTSKIRAEMPPDSHPDFYREVEMPETISVYRE